MTGFTDRRGIGEPTPAGDRHAPVKVAGVRVGSTDKALCVLEPETGVRAWLPRSEISEVEEGLGNTVRVTVPAWLARDKGFATTAGDRQGRLF